jgi:hypothetical protein
VLCATTLHKLKTKTAMKKDMSYPTLSKYAIISGITGILAFAILITSLVVRNQSAQQGIYVARFHDLGVIIQFLLLVPVTIALYKLSQRQLQSMSLTTLKIGIGALFLTVLFLVLQFPNILAIVLYMFPQGVFGAWLIVVCWGMKGVIPQWLRWFGIIVGVGLALVGLFPLGYAIFVDKIILRIPAAPDEEVAKVPTDTIANAILHQILFIGTLIGVLTLPVWTIIFGVRLRREKV